MLVVTARRPAASSKPRLTPRQRQILAGLGSGYTRKEIAAALGISYWTVIAHLDEAQKRFGAVNTLQLIDKTIRHVTGADRARWQPPQPEAPYRDELAALVGGEIEVRLSVGRVDVATDTEVFEVEPVRSWRRGLQQAIVYGVVGGRHSNLAIYSTETIQHRKALEIWTGLADTGLELGLWVRRAGAWARVDAPPVDGWEPGDPPIRGRVLTRN